VRRYFEFVLAHRLAVLGVVALLTVLALASLSRAVVATSIGGLFLGESPEYLRYLDRSEAFAGDELLVVAFETSELMEDDWRRRLEAAADAIREEPAVDSVATLLDVQLLDREGLDLRVATAGERADDRLEEGDALLERLRADPMVAGLLLSDDGSRAAVIVTLTADGSRHAEEGPRIAQEVIARLEVAELAGPGGLHAGGWVAVIAEILVQTRLNIRRIFPFVAGLLLITVWLMFRRLWPAFAAVGVSLIAVAWTMGFAIAVDRHVNLLMATVPALVLVVGFSDVVHLCSAYLLELEDGRSKRDAILASAEDVGRACLFTSLTTFTGFVCISLVPIPLFRLLGLVLGFGVGAALLLAMTLCPILFSYLPRPKPLRGGASSRIHAWLDGLLAGLARLASSRPRAVIGAFAAFALVCVVGASRIHVEVDMLERFAASNALRVDNEWLLEHFSGTATVDLYLDLPEDGGALEPDVIAAVDALGRQVRGLPHVDATLSLTDLLGRIHRTLTDDRPDAGPLPSSRAAAAQYLLLFEMGGGEGLAPLVDFDRRSLRMVIRLDDAGYRAAREAGEAAEELALDLLPEGASVEATGMNFLLGDWLDEVVRGQRNGLLLSLAVIALMMVVALRSPRVGLLSMAPNVLPLIALGGWVGWTWDQVDSDTLIPAILAIGIGVDDTIHFLVRYRVEAARSDDVVTAIDRTFRFAGRAIVMTTVILVVGFAPFVLSDYFTTRLFGTLLPLALLVALFADLLLVPALVRVGAMQFDVGGPTDPPARSGSG
jgi:uncharacterized protein